MDDIGGLLQGFTRLSNDIVAERDRRAAEGARNLDIAFDLLAMIVRHYHEEYCPREHLPSCLESTLGAYPWADHSSAVPIERVREWILERCDQELDSVPDKVIDALRGEYLTLLWRALRDLDAVPSPKDHDTDHEKIRSMLVGLGFREPYRPRWGYSYICGELETAQDALLHIDPALVDAKTIELIRNNTILVLKSYKRFIQMLLSFYGQHAFGTSQQLVAVLKPDVARPDKYLKTCGLKELIDFLTQLEGYAQERAENEQFWREFVDVVVMSRDLIAQLQQVCEEALGYLKLNNRAAYTVEEVLNIRTHVIHGLAEHLLGLRDDYQAAFPIVVALKRCIYYEDGRIHIDYLDEMGVWGVVRKDIRFQGGNDFYFLSRPAKSPLILPVEDWHQDFIVRHDSPGKNQLDDDPIKRQLDDNDLRNLFEKFEKCRKELERSGQRVVVVPSFPPAASPLEKMGITNDGSIVDRSRLINIIHLGESAMVEFKATCRDPSRNDEIDRGKIAEEMAALANTRGGILVFGIPDKNKPRDIEMALKMRQELAPSPQEQERRGEKWGPKYVVDSIADVAKGSSGDPKACWPSVQYTPHFFDARDVGLEKGAVLVLAVCPMGPDDLCRVNQQVYVRKGTSCQTAPAQWIDDWYRTKRKRWL